MTTYPATGSPYVAQLHPAFFLNAGEAKAGIDFALLSGGLSVSGFITAGGIPLENVGVDIWNGSISLYTFTNADGYYELNNLSAGEAEIQIKPHGTPLAFTGADVNLDG